MARRRPRTFQSWALGLVGAAITALVVYKLRVMVVEDFTQHQLAQVQKTMAQVQQQSLQQQAQIRAKSQAQAQARREEADRQVMDSIRRAEEWQKKEAAWNAFFHQSPDCDVWRDDRHMVECQNKVIRAKRDFEHLWAAGELHGAG